MSQIPNSSNINTHMTAYRNTQDEISKLTDLGSYRNLWLETPLKLMLKLVKQHIPNIEKSQVNIEEKRKLWKLVKEKLDAAGYHFSAIQIERKYQYIERYYKNAKSAENAPNHVPVSAPAPEEPMPPPAIGSITKQEEENNTQNSKARCSKNLHKTTDAKYGEIFDLLESWGLADLKAKFKANYIVLQALEYLTEADIIELIPKIGQRAIFRAKLNQWRQEKLSPPSKLTSTSSPSTEGINVPEPKKIKLEPGLEEKSPPPPLLQLQQPIQQQISPQALLQPLPTTSQQNGAHKMYGNLTISTKPKAKRVLKKNNNPNNTPNIQSRVQQFFIGSSPSLTATAPAPPTSTGTGTGTGICRLPSPPSVNTVNGPRLTLSKPVTSPSLYYNIPSHIECRRFPTVVTPRPAIPATQFHTPPVSTTPVRVINSDNLSTANAMQVRKTPTNATAPAFVADLTPFATSIIRVETNCETQYPNNGTPSPQNPITKLKRTTIIQKLKPDNKTLPIQPQISKPIIMPRPIQALQNPSKAVKSPAVGQSKSPEVPRPKPFLIPKKEPLDEEEQKDEDQETMDWNEFCEARKQSEVLTVVETEKEPEPEPEHESEHEAELEFDPESNPEVEEFTLADAVSELPDLKDEILDSDSHSHSDHDGDNENKKEKDLLLKEIPDPKDSHDSQDTQDTQDTQEDSQEPKGDLTRLDIRQILMGSKIGRQIIKRYVAEEILDDPRRKLLIDTIAQHCFENKIHITPTYCKEITEEIIEIFPNERMEDFFVRKGKKLRSPIYSKFHAIRREFFRKKTPAAETIPTNKKNKTKENKKKSSLSVQEMDYDDDDNLIIS